MISRLIFIIYVLFYLRCGEIYCFTTSDVEKSNATKLNQINYFSKDIEYVNGLIKNANISQECKESIRQTLTPLNNFDDWGFQMINSWGKFPPSGVLSGTFTDYGDYDQCLSIRPNQVIGKSQYCLIDISLPLPEPMPQHQNIFHKVNVSSDFTNKTKNKLFDELSKDASFFYWVPIRVGICTPNKCSRNDIKLIAEININKTGFILKDVNCDTINNTKIDSIQIFAILFLSTFIIWTIFATVFLRYAKTKRNVTFLRILNAFSLENNLKKLMTLQTDHQLSCIHGLKVLNIFWVITSHVIIWNSWQIYTNIFELKDILSAYKNQLLLHGLYSVETFFFISGILTSYVTLKLSEGKYENLNKIAFLLSRFIRLTPQLAIFLLLFTLTPLLSSGPEWNLQIQPIINNCYNNWWQNLLYMQNLIDAKNECAKHLWYVSTDMQFHWIAFLVIIALHKNIRFGFMVNSLLIIISSVLTSVMFYIYDFPPGGIPTAANSNFFSVFEDTLFQKPWPHASVYFIGLAFGYVVYENRPKKLTTLQKLLIWSSMLLGYIITIFNTQYWVYGRTTNALVSASLYPFTRFVWAINTATLIWMCITGNGGFINRFLSWKALIPLSRLTYSVYLTHIWIVWIYWGSKRTLFELNALSFSLLFLGMIFMSYILGAIFSLLFESPFFVLHKNIINYFISENKHKINVHNPNSDIDELKKLNCNRNETLLE